MSYFSSFDIDPNAKPKITVYEVGGVMKASWDREDPELIAAGINDLTPEEWAEVMDRVKAQAANDPIIEKRDDGNYFIPAGGGDPIKLPD